MASPTAREILNTALKRREELRLESEALDNLIATYQNILGFGNPLRETDQEQLDLYRSASKRVQRSAHVAEMIDAARRIIIAEKRPMKRGELVRRLEASGFEIAGADKSKVFGTNLWRSEKFVTVAGEGYWPKDVALPSESRNRKA